METVRRGVPREARPRRAAAKGLVGQFEPTAYRVTDLRGRPPLAPFARAAAAFAAEVACPARRAIHAFVPRSPAIRPGPERSASSELGRAACRERVGQYDEISVVAGE